MRPSLASGRAGVAVRERCSNRDRLRIYKVLTKADVTLRIDYLNARSSDGCNIMIERYLSYAWLRRKEWRSWGEELQGTGTGT